MDEMSFAQAMKHYFGPRPGHPDTAAAFMTEYKALDDNDKAFFRKELERVGYSLKS